MIDPTSAAWLVDSDPVLRWQVERDLLGAGDHVWQATRACVATERFGATLLAHQDDDGQWVGAVRTPSLPWHGRGSHG